MASESSSDTDFSDDDEWSEATSCGRESFDEDLGWEDQLVKLQRALPRASSSTSIFDALLQNWIKELAVMAKVFPLEIPDARLNCIAVLSDCFSNIGPLIADQALGIADYLCSTFRFGFVSNFVSKLNDLETLNSFLRAFGVTAKEHLLELIGVVTEGFYDGVALLVNVLLERIGEDHLSSLTEDELVDAATSIVNLNNADLIRTMNRMGYELTQYVCGEMLRLAAEEGFTEVVQAILELPEVDVDFADMYALRYASHNRRIDIIEMLLWHGATVPRRDAMVRERSEADGWRTLQRVVQRVAARRTDALRSVFICRSALVEGVADRVAAYAFGNFILPKATSRNDLLDEVHRLCNLRKTCKFPTKRRRQASHSAGGKKKAIARRS